MSNKLRLDQLVNELLPVYSKTQIQSYIMQGKVKVNGMVSTKPGQAFATDVKIECDIQEQKYVSRAGFKLEKALDEFKIDVAGLTIMDAGLSTGGFTDCMLQRGAAKIYGVDVGYGQVHEKIRAHPQVVVMEQTNLRNLRNLGEKVDLITLDLSFISVLKNMDAVDAVLKDDGKLVVLIKPQFEARKEDVGRGGIIKDPKVHQEASDRVVAGITQHGYQLQGIIDSPILGTSGNKEFLAYFIRKI